MPKKMAWAGNVIRNDNNSEKKKKKNIPVTEKLNIVFVIVSDQEKQPKM